MPETFKLLINENIWSGIKTLLEEQGYDVCAVRSECPGMKDRDIILKSAREERVILTQDHDFGELVYRHECKPYGFVFFRILPNSSKRQQEVILGFFKGFRSLNIPLKHHFFVFDGLTVRSRPIE